MDNIGALVGARRLVRAIVLKDSKAFELLYSRLTDALTRAWNDGMRSGIVSSLDRLRELGPGKFTEKDGALIFRELENHVGAEAIAAAVRGPVLNLSESLFRLGAKEVGDGAGIDIAFNRPDLKSLQVLSRGNLYWVGNSWDARTSGIIDNVLRDYFTSSLTREQLRERFANDFAGVTEQGKHYWETLADHTATRTREMGRVIGYERAGLRFVQIRAALDARTTRVCRSMHGRIIPVSALRAQVNAYLDAVDKKDLEAAKSAWVMHDDKSDLEGVKTTDIPTSTRLPPYHFRCRTITVAYFKPRNAPELIVGDGVNDAQREIVSARTPAEHANFVADLKRSAERLEFNKKDLRDELIKHAKNEMAIDNETDYVAKSRRVVKNADRVFIQSYKGSTQYVFACSGEKAYAVVDTAFQFRGCYGHEMPGGYDRCLENLKKTKSEITF